MKSRYLVPSIILIVTLLCFLSITVPAFKVAKEERYRRVACYKTLCEKHDTTFYHIEGPILHCSSEDGGLIQLSGKVCRDGS